MPGPKAATLAFLVLTIGGCLGAPLNDPEPTPIERSIRGLFPASASETVVLRDGDTYALDARIVTHDVGTGKPIRMFAYNGQLPGPTLRVPQHANVTIPFTNGLDVPTTVHWHGLRLDNAHDGVPHATQAPIEPGATYNYSLRFPDEGLYWYHPHVREDMQQELGLAGAIIVVPPEDASSAREIPLLVDDLLLNGADLAAIYAERANSVLMGRYGDLLLANMRPDWSERAAPAERLRLLLVNAANARPFNLSFENATRAELVGLDGGALREPRAIEHVWLAPGERATIDLLMPEEGAISIVNDNGIERRSIGRIAVDASLPRMALETDPRAHERAARSMDAALAQLDSAPRVMWTLDARIGAPRDPHARHEMAAPQEGAPAEGIEWENADPYGGLATTTDEASWILDTTDPEATYALGSHVRLTLVNPSEGAHPMQHPIHIHGQRFLVTSIDGQPPTDEAWRDTVLVPAGSRVELLVEMSNPGEWMAHCHINEHFEAGMSTTFAVR